MGVTEFIMLICGIAFLVLSFFVGNETLSQHPENTDADLFSADKLAEVKKNLEESLEEKADDLLEDTKNKLSSASNETIISVDEFSRQTLERINHNHEEVVFMYNMLQTKEEELKKNIEEFKKTFDELEKKKEEVKNEVMAVTLPTASGIEMARKRSSTKATDKVSGEAGENVTVKKSSKPVTKKSTRESAPAVIPSALLEMQKEKSIDSGEGIEDNKTGKILELYQQKKSVLEISKALGLGQGEVKLVIDLYGKN